MSNPRVLIQYDQTETNAQQVDANNAAHVHILDASGNPYFTAANPAYVQATDLDIRDLSSTQDSVEVIGVKPDGTNTQPSMDAVARAGFQKITDGTETVNVTTSNQLETFPADFLLEVQKGNVPGHAIVHKFGESSVGTTLQPVTTSGFYRTPTTATSLEFVSANANDTSAGTGAREITVIGLNSSWAEVSQTVATNGTTAAALGTDLTRLYRWYVSSSGTYANQTTGSHVGALTIQETGGGNVWSTIPASVFPEGQSQIAVYSIPTGKKGYILSQYISVDSVKSVDVFAFRRDNIDDVSSPYSGIMRLINKFIGVSGPTALKPKSPMGAIQGPADVGFMGVVSAGTADVSIDFEILLVDD